MSEQVRLLSYEQLRERGIAYTPRSLRRLEAENKFPKRVTLGKRTVAWVESEIDAHLRDQVAAREVA